MLGHSTLRFIPSDLVEVMIVRTVRAVAANSRCAIFIMASLSSLLACSSESRAGHSEVELAFRLHRNAVGPPNEILSYLTPRNHWERPGANARTVSDDSKLEHHRVHCEAGGSTPLDVRRACPRAPVQGVKSLTVTR